MSFSELKAKGSQVRVIEDPGVAVGDKRQNEHKAGGREAEGAPDAFGGTRVRRFALGRTKDGRENRGYRGNRALHLDVP
jgi:hypothetical protein